MSYYEIDKSCHYLITFLQYSLHLLVIIFFDQTGVSCQNKAGVEMSQRASNAGLADSACCVLSSDKIEKVSINKFCFTSNDRPFCGDF